MSHRSHVHVSTKEAGWTIETRIFWPHDASANDALSKYDDHVGEVLDALIEKRIEEEGR